MSCASTGKESGKKLRGRDESRNEFVINEPVESHEGGFEAGRQIVRVKTNARLIREETGGRVKKARKPPREGYSNFNSPNHACVVARKERRKRGKG